MKAINVSVGETVRYMLDTSIFNRIVDGEIPLDRLVRLELFATHVQRDELDRTTDGGRRNDLLSAFRDVGALVLPTQTAIWDDSSWDETAWSADDGIYEALLARIKELDTKDRGLNQSRDARIAEAAIKAGLILVTDDSNLYRAASEHGCSVMGSKDFFKSGADDV